MRLVKRRRRECKTNYLRRLKILKSERPILVFRRTNKYSTAQYVLSHEAQDKVEFTFSSKMLLKHGWPEKAKGSLKSVSASYLTGFLAGKILLKEKKESPIVDFGMIQTLHKTKVFAFLKGLIDAGIDVSCKEECFPEENRIKGEHLKNKIPFNTIKQNLEKI